MFADWVGLSSSSFVKESGSGKEDSHLLRNWALVQQSLKPRLWHEAAGGTLGLHWSGVSLTNLPEIVKLEIPGLWSMQ